MHYVSYPTVRKTSGKEGAGVNALNADEEAAFCWKVLPIKITSHGRKKKKKKKSTAVFYQQKKKKKTEN